jgi:hypothetical protein
MDSMADKAVSILSSNSALCISQLPYNAAIFAVHFALVALHLRFKPLCQLPHLAENRTVRVLDDYIALPKIKPRHVSTYTVPFAGSPDGQPIAIYTQNTAVTNSGARVPIETHIWIGQNKCLPLIDINFGSAFVEPMFPASDMDVVSHSFPSKLRRIVPTAIVSDSGHHVERLFLAAPCPTSTGAFHRK